MSAYLSIRIFTDFVFWKEKVMALGKAFCWSISVYSLSSNQQDSMCCDSLLAKGMFWEPFCVLPGTNEMLVLCQPNPINKHEKQHKTLQTASDTGINKSVLRQHVTDPPLQWQWRLADWLGRVFDVLLCLNCSLYECNYPAAQLSGRGSGWIISVADALGRRVRRPENKGSPASSLGLFSPDSRCWCLGSVWFTSSSLLPKSSSWRAPRQASYSPARALVLYTVYCCCCSNLVTSADFWRILTNPEPLLLLYG